MNTSQEANQEARMLTVGLDGHAKTSTVRVLDDGGRTVEDRTLRGSPALMVGHLRQLKESSGQEMQVCFEASCNYGWLHDQLAPFCKRVAVAHPGQLRLIFRGKRKSDRVDAQKLAKLLLLDEVPPVHVPSIDVRSWRGMIEHRAGLVDKRTRAKNGLRAVLRSQAVPLPEGKKAGWLWTKAGRAWLAKLELAMPSDAVRRDMLLEEVEHYQRQILRVTQELDRLGKDHPGVRLLRTIPGVGRRTAEAFCAYVDNPSRFRKINCVGSYFGLVPSQDSSAGVNRLGRITRQGPGTVRKLLVEAAWRGVCKSPSLRALFERITHGETDRRKRALIATAHHLARTMLSMLRNGRTWEERIAAGSKSLSEADAATPIGEKTKHRFKEKTRTAAA